MLDSCKMVEKQSDAVHTFLWHFFQVLNRILLHMLLPHVQIAFLKFTSCDKLALIWCIPIPAVGIKHSLIVKTFLFKAIQLIQMGLIQTIQFSISTGFVYTFKFQNSSILNNSVYCKYRFNFKNSSISGKSVHHKHSI